MNTKIKIASFLGIALVSVFLLSCGEDQEQRAHLIVRLTDAPADYQEVWVDILDVQVNTGNDDNGWKSLDIKEGKYDLLKLTNGLDTLLGETDLPAGKLSQIRLILGNDNSVRVDDQMQNLSTPSAQQTGLKVQVHMDLEAGKTYEILLDFDAARSIVATGNGEFLLKPVIRAIVEELGAISGLVEPIESNPAIHAITGTDTVSTMINNEGSFLIGGLSHGTYRVVFVPIEGYVQEELIDIEVIAGETTDVGTVEIDHL